jgi:hypothetical protein
MCSGTGSSLKSQLVRKSIGTPTRLVEWPMARGGGAADSSGGSGGGAIKIRDPRCMIM